MPDSTSPFSLAYLPLIIRLKCLEPAELPVYLGSTLHGVLGWSLLPQRDTYNYLFENRREDPGKFDTVNPLLIDPPEYHGPYRPGDELRFQVILIGSGIQYAEKFVKALSDTRIFAFGAGRKKFALMEIRHGQGLYPVWTPESAVYRQTKELVIGAAVQDDASCCSVHFITPLRIRRNGGLLMDIDFSVLIRNITRRIQELTSRYGGMADEQEIEKICTLSKQVQTETSGLYLNSVQRYSERKGRKMDFSGLQGAMVFSGMLTPFTPWLRAAQLLHIGRNSTLGYGKIGVVFW